MARHIRPLVEQPTAAPTRKITAAALAGAVVTIGVYVARLFDVELPAEVATASTTVLSFAAGYLVKDRQN